MTELTLDKITIGDRYQVQGRISTGSYTEVFVARDQQNEGREVVIKALNADLQGTPDVGLEQTLIENFDKEASILESISHPNIIAMLDSGVALDSNGREFQFILLEYMQGGDLLRFTRGQPNSCLSLGQMLGYFRQICQGLLNAVTKNQTYFFNHPKIV